MGQVAEVVDVEDDGNIKVDLGGGDTAIADYFQAAGEDSPPLPADTVALVDGPETGTVQVTGFADETERVAEPGEKRTYARDSSGTVVGVLYLKGDGTYEVLAADASFLRAEDFYTYLDVVIAATSTGLSGVPVVGGALKIAFDGAITAALPLRVASISTVFKSE